MNSRAPILTEEHVRTDSRPSQLKITDLKVANLVGVPFRSSIIRLETNQGLVGYGEVRDQASATYALMLKSRIVGENPCNLDKIFRKIKQFGFHARQGGGVCGIEMALMDLAGKAYGVPAYALVGGQFRDKVRCYADTPTELDPVRMGERLLERKRRGYTLLKMDIGINLLAETPGTVIAPEGALEERDIMHPFTGIQVTQKGVEQLAAYVEQVRSIVGYDVALAADHFGHIALDSCIRIARALEPYTLAWVEDMIPWQFTEQWRTLTESVAVPTCTGEDIYLTENFKPLIDNSAIRIVHPDPATSGGIAETKRLGNYAEEKGIAMALHLAASPVATMACVQLAAATHNFLALEHHAADVPFWNDLVTGLPKPIIQDGYIQVPEKPGLGFDDVNLELFAEHLDPKAPVLFEDSSMWDNEYAHDRLWS